MHIDYEATRYNWAKKRRAELVKNTTKAEGALKRLLNSHKIPYLFQEIILNERSFYIVDFVLGEYIIEVDGETHMSLAAKVDDKKRDNFLRSLGYKVLRIKNNEIINTPEQVLYNLLTLGVFKIDKQPKAKKNVYVIGDKVKMHRSKKIYTIIAIEGQKCSLQNEKGVISTRNIYQLKKHS